MINKDIVSKQEAYGWGKSVVKNLSDELRREFVGMRGFSVQNLWNMRQFYLEYYQDSKLQPMVGEISCIKNVVIFQKVKNVLERALIAIELKIGIFKPEYAGKMSFYLSLLNDTVKLPEENPSIGIIICKEKNRTIVEYAWKETNQPIGVATYKLSKNLPQELKEYLPTVFEIERNLVEYLKVLDVK